jgi:hypothetical protein
LLITIIEVIEMKDNKIQIGSATVTPKGLSFGNMLFTNQAMIKSRWFEHSERYGCWQVPVLYSEEFPNKLFLFQSIEVATAVEYSPRFSHDEMEAYFQVILKLKALLHDKYKRKDDK